ncbi:hypothetical protein FRC17_008932, partial [Serendipita sp. 399]
MPPKRPRRSGASVSSSSVKRIATKASNNTSDEEEIDPGSDADVSMMGNSSPVKGGARSLESQTAAAKNGARRLSRQNTNGSTKNAKRNLNGKRTRETDEENKEESDDMSEKEEQDSSTKASRRVNSRLSNGHGTATINPSGARPFVQVRRISELSRASSVSGRSTPVLSRRTTLSSVTRSRRNTSTPGTSEPSHTSDGEILTDDGSLQFEDHMSSSSSSGSEFEDDSVDAGSDIDIDAIQLSDSEDDSIVMTATRSGKSTPSGKKGKGSKFFSKDLKTASQRSKKSKASDRILGEADNTDDEILNAALRESIVTAAEERKAKGSTAGAGSSFSRAAGKALGRFAKRRGSTKDKAISVVDSDSSEEPLTSKSKSKSRSKGKGKARKNEPSDVISVSSSLSSDLEYRGNNADDPMEIDSDTLLSDDEEDELEIAKQIEEEKKARAILKKEEMAERKRLGRKLTYAEKATISLYLHHPELRTCWGDLEKREIIKPVPGVQPPELKIKLLPFQLESLTWMRKQENGEWGGGMLADEMGMGKTIQTLALL